MKSSTLKFLLITAIAALILNIGMVNCNAPPVGQGVGPAKPPGGSDSGSSTSTIKVFFGVQGSDDKNNAFENFIYSPFFKWLGLILGILLVIGASACVLKTSGATGGAASA